MTINWNEIKSLYPNTWIVVEAINAYTDSSGKREIVAMSVLETFKDGFSAYQKYKELHKIDTGREYYYLHTSREKLDISEELWIGIRFPNAASNQV
jgi:hypothetical protein